MAVTAALVKELRERTGAGMMECKKFLVEHDGDIDAAVEAMRKSGQAKADKKAGRVAAEGLIGAVASDDGRTAALVEVNCETDFVAKEDEFRQFVDAVARCVLAHRPAGVEALGALALDDGQTVDERRRELIARIGENMTVRRASVLDAGDGGQVGVYLHAGRIGVAVGLRGGSVGIARDVAMHVAASRPLCVSEHDIPAETLAAERDIFTAQAADSGKPAEIVEKMVTGRLRKYIGEVTLLGQPFVKDPDQSVSKFLAGHDATVTGFERLEVGEGIEKKSENFAEEVMSQVNRA